ncbi:hypothetical protein [Staphylococcus equorum]|uniref:Uncharacterized protein n=1 Tax=Staphylococcus equorum TaxID=246432 RepID=A0AAP7IF69_9STAP|nr:hypothetical protein [Staphylococcus equorum]OEK58975.1 hypothetical protein ASS94_01220 [Staphylococcus equorum]
MENNLNDLINELYEEKLNVTIVENNNTLEIESDKTHISVEVYNIKNSDLILIELEDDKLSELEIIIYNYSMVSPTLQEAYEMIINEIRVNETEGIESI